MFNDSLSPSAIIAGATSIVLLSIAAPGRKERSRKNGLIETSKKLIESRRSEIKWSESCPKWPLLPWAVSTSYKNCRTHRAVHWRKGSINRHIVKRGMGYTIAAIPKYFLSLLSLSFSLCFSLYVFSKQFIVTVLIVSLRCSSNLEKIIIKKKEKKKKKRLLEKHWHQNSMKLALKES